MSKIMTMLMAIVLMVVTTMARAETLHSDEVARFVDATRTLLEDEAFTEHLLTAWQDLDGERQFPGSLMPSELAALIQGRDGHAFFEATLETHGFDTAGDWGRTGDLSLLALMSLDMAGSEQTLQTELDRMARQLEGELPISDQQRQNILEMVSHTRQLLDRVAAVPQAHREAVRPHADGLREALDYYRDN